MRKLNPKFTALYETTWLIRGWSSWSFKLPSCIAQAVGWPKFPAVYQHCVNCGIRAGHSSRCGCGSAIPRGVLTPLILSISLSAAKTQHISSSWSAGFPHALCHRVSTFLALWCIILHQAMLIEWAICFRHEDCFGLLHHSSWEREKIGIATGSQQSGEHVDVAGLCLTSSSLEGDEKTWKVRGEQGPPSFFSTCVLNSGTNIPAEALFSELTVSWHFLPP